MKRKSERIAFGVPIWGRVGLTNVAITDLSVFGAGVHHRLRLNTTANETNLVFRWREQEINLDCRIARTRLERHVGAEASLTLYHSGLRFIRPSERETSIVRRIISSRVARALREQRANAFAVSIDEVDEVTLDLAEPPSSIYLNELMSVLTATRTAYVRCTLEGAVWKQSVVETPEQPANGFTIAGAEGDESIRMLCRTYEMSPPEGRQMIRTFAHLSLTDPSEVARDRFHP
ncbi:MAG TPA: hypothetical protein VIL97_00265 [Thermoanaerobaculia bacterium]